MLTRLLTGHAATPRDGRVQDGTTMRRLPSVKAWQRPGEHRPAHRVGDLGSGVRLPQALRALAHAAAVTEEEPYREPSWSHRCHVLSIVVLAGRAPRAISSGHQRTPRSLGEDAERAARPWPAGTKGPRGQYFQTATVLSSRSRRTSWPWRVGTSNKAQPAVRSPLLRGTGSSGGSNAKPAIACS
jgi:hypothetical protein